MNALLKPTPAPEALYRDRRAVLESVPVGLASPSVVPLGGCVESLSVTIYEFDAAYRTDTGSTWWPWLEVMMMVVVKNTGSEGGAVEVTARVSVDGGKRYTMTGEVTLEPNKCERAIGG